MNDLDIPQLSDDEKRAIAEAASDAYEKLRWQVGDNEAMRRELILLARDSYCAGRAAITLPTVTVITPSRKPGQAVVSGSIC